ncbi:polyphosphate kinase 2, PA0141 family [Kaistia soli DSM 19436]|uniref:ADP/GDP-polyphosphate phosphotransferase n=1 Tax=Kaistia soli DSM 19436 TaxID=1122133 RepID=A0A1M5IBY8_9HYPH|nr:polyphosphate kinase 2 [Kaistia soli]SHG25816.1 polyphosphate kinase 2, PA0141 family [Kaistia soli DSM 19436]
MDNKHKVDKKDDKRADPAVFLRDPAENADGKLGRKVYETELEKLQTELVRMQQWAKQSGARICILFEGRDAAGKGGVIKAIMERVNPRIFRVIALPPPTEREKTQLYIQRYLPYLPAAGEIVIFDRSWYNRAGVERVMGFCTEDQVTKFLSGVGGVERAMVESGMILLKYWLEVSPEEQTRRIEARIDDPKKVWKLSPMDVLSYERWYDYSRARDAMFAASDTGWAPWFVAQSDDKKRARLNIISHLLSKIPYERIKSEKVKLPKRQKAGGYVEPDMPLHKIPEPF